VSAECESGKAQTQKIRVNISVRDVHPVFFFASRPVPRAATLCNAIIKF